MITCHGCGRQFKTMVSPLYCSCGAITATEPLQHKQREPTAWLRWIKLLRKTEDRGVGDTVARIASAFGGERFKQFSKRIGIPCGCTERQEAWNRDYPYE